MSAFTECWKNLEKSGHGPTAGELPWLNELNQAVFAQLQKRLPKRIKLRSCSHPAFIYWTEAAGGYGVDSHTATVQSFRFRLPEGSFEQRVEAATTWMLSAIDRPEVGTAFLYALILPMGELALDGSKNRHHVCVRMKVLGETVDVEQQK